MDRLVFQKAAAYCAYQERTQAEVRARLKKWGTWGDAAEAIIAELVVQNYLSEERFAKAYSGGKFRMKSWGRLKIKQELARRGLSSYNVAQGMAEITEGEYRERLRQLLQKKWDMVVRSEANPLKRRQKLLRYAASKGYEQDLVMGVLAEITG